MAEARWITPQPLCHPQPCVPCGRRISPLLQAEAGREGRGWCQLRQLEEELCSLYRPTDQVVEVIHIVGGEDSRRRMLCPWRAHPLASTLPAVARATAGRFMRCEWLVGRVACVLRGSASDFCVSCSPLHESLENGGPADSRRQWLRPLRTDGQPCGEQLTQKSLARPLRTPGPRPIRYSHLTKRPAVARATAGKVLAGGCARQGQSTRRGLSSSPTKWNTSTTWSVDRASWLSSSSSWQRWCHLRPSRPGWPWAASTACARKAHKVEDDGGAEACPRAPQAASLATPVTLRPPMGVWCP